MLQSANHAQSQSVGVSMTGSHELRLSASWPAPSHPIHRQRSASTARAAYEQCALDGSAVVTIRYDTIVEFNVVDELFSKTECASRPAATAWPLHYNHTPQHLVPVPKFYHTDVCDIKTFIRYS